MATATEIDEEASALRRDVAPGVHRVVDGFVNWHLVEDGDALLAIDAGLRPSLASLRESLMALERLSGDLAAIVLTHAHFDHVGFAERARRELGVEVWCHEHEVALAAHPRRYGAERRLPAYLRHRATLRMLGSVLASGALWAPPIAELRTFSDGEELPLPGRPRVVATPGHTPGHASFLLPGADAIVSGDALVTRDPYTGREGPRLVARAATADSARAWSSLDRLAATGASIVLPGHGEPWPAGVRDAVERAKATPQA